MYINIYIYIFLSPACYNPPPVITLSNHLKITLKVLPKQNSKYFIAQSLS